MEPRQAPGHDLGRGILLGIIVSLLAALCGVSLWAVVSLCQPRSFAGVSPTIMSAQHAASPNLSPSTPESARAAADAVAYVPPPQEGDAAVVATVVAPAGDTVGTAAERGPPQPTTARGAITIVTFGYSFGPAPRGCRFVADVRNIHAGSFTGTGLMASVQKQVMATRAAKRWEQVFVTQWIPALNAGDKVAIGCAIGHHRSVAMSVVLARHLRASGFKVRLVHRDISKPG